MNKRILLCDDDHDIVKTLEGFFIAKGYSLTASLTGEDALEKIDQENYDLVIMDLKLPGISGVDAIKKIKEKSSNSKVIVLSGKSEEYEDELKEVSVDGVLQKPINIIELTEAISDVIAGRSIATKEKKSGTPKARLLIAESRALVATNFKEYFESYDKCGGEYEVELVDKSDAVIDAINSLKPDVLLISVCMEGSGALSSKLVDMYRGGNPEHLMFSNDVEMYKVGNRVKEVCMEKNLLK